MSSSQNQKMNFEPSLSFDGVSKFFSLPLSEAADILGVSASVLKKLCNQNGLDRWPHRKYLAGKTIEEIKMEAAKEKSKADARKGNVKNKTPTSAPEMSKIQGRHSGGKTTYTWHPHNMIASGLSAEISEYSDEFKYGFPSSGLSKSTNRWWECGSDKNVKLSDDSLSKDECNINSDVKDASESQVNGHSPMECDRKPDSGMQESGSEQNKVSLSTIRKRAVEEGQKALKHGILKKHGTDQLGKEETILLRRLFQPS